MKKTALIIMLAAVMAVSSAVSALAASFSPNWFEDANGWHIKDANGNVIKNAWVCDDVQDPTKSTWYLIDGNGNMISAPLVQDGTGNYYSIETAHNGYYGSLRHTDGVYDGVTLTFEQGHGGSFGAVRGGLDALKAKFPVTSVAHINNNNCSYTTTYSGKGGPGGAGGEGGGSSSGGGGGGGSSSGGGGGGSSSGGGGGGGSSSGGGGSSYYGSPTSGQTKYYTVTWKNLDGTVLKTEQVKAGTTPVYTGATPTYSDENNCYTYTFNNVWQPMPYPIYADTSFTALYLMDSNYYKGVASKEDHDKIAEITAAITNGYQMSDVEMEVAILRWLTDNVTYAEGSTEGQTVHEVINEGTGVCAGYANTFTAMCDACGIEARTVTNSNHAWNNIKLDGEWYQVETSGINIDSQYTRMHYINMTTEDGHKSPKDGINDKCTATKYGPDYIVNLLSGKATSKEEETPPETTVNSDMQKNIGEDEEVFSNAYNSMTEKVEDIKEVLDNSEKEETEEIAETPEKEETEEIAEIPEKEETENEEPAEADEEVSEEAEDITEE